VAVPLARRNTLIPSAVAQAVGASDGSRDGRARRELSLGVLDLAVLRNTVPPDSTLSQPPANDLLQLIQAKNLFARALPNMPKEYITRLVFCHKHKTLVLRRGDKIVGAICFRPFFEQGFLEIVFCAVDSQEQVRYALCPPVSAPGLLVLPLPRLQQ